MIDKIEKTIAVAFATATISAPVIVAIYFTEYVLRILGGILV